MNELQSTETHLSIFPIHFARTFSMQRLGPYDPSADFTPNSFSKAFFYRSQPATLHFERAADGVVIKAFGPHAEELLESTLQGLNQDDRYSSFTTEDAGILRLFRMFPGLRVLRFPWLYEMTCSAILQQKIRTVDAMRDWRRISNRFGIQAPLGLIAFPSAEMLSSVPIYELQALGVGPQRAGTLLRFAQESRFLPLDPAMTFADLRKRLLRIPGIGPWTTESVLGYAAGDTDAAIPGDLHLPRVICYALAGELRGTDDRMLELLEPFRGHRFRIIRLLYEARIDVP